MISLSVCIRGFSAVRFFREFLSAGSVFTDKRKESFGGRMLLIRVENRYQGGVFTGCANGVRIAGEPAPWRGTADIARSLVRRRDAPASASAGVSGSDMSERQRYHHRQCVGRIVQSRNSGEPWN